MVKKFRKQSNKGVGVRFGGLIGGFARGISNLFEFIVGLDRQGQSEYQEEGEIESRTKNGKKIKGTYGFRVKIGLPARSREAKTGLNEIRNLKIKN